jgi:hypothetical protein
MVKGVEALLAAHVHKAPRPIAETIHAVAERRHNGVAMLETLVSEELKAERAEGKRRPLENKCKSRSDDVEI